MPSDVSLSDRAGAPEERGGKGPGAGNEGVWLVGWLVGWLVVVVVVVMMICYDYDYGYG